MKRRCWEILGMLLCGFVGLKAQSYAVTNVNKILLHKGLYSDQLVFLFDKEPVCNEVPSADDMSDATQKKLAFFIPRAMIANRETKQAMARINKERHDGYELALQEVERPIKGVKICIAYRPDKIFCKYSPFHAISMQSGLIFNLHKREVLDFMQKNTNSLLKAVYHKAPPLKPKVALDFGHGGHDFGKVVNDNAVKEKDITFNIGNQVAQLLQQKGYGIVLTRAHDEYVPLDQRTTYAQQQQAQLFVSLHANAGPETASGIETYWTPRSQFAWQQPYYERFDRPFLTLLQERDQRSHYLAECVHRAVLSSVHDFKISDRKVKHAVAQVLLPDIPAALIEMGFLSNKKEMAHLLNPHYQLLIAHGICDGIEQFYNTSGWRTI